MDSKELSDSYEKTQFAIKNLNSRWLDNVRRLQMKLSILLLGVMLGLPGVAGGSVLDTDEDGLPDEIESIWGSNPLDPDSDDDGLLDGVEDANFNGELDLGDTDPTDPDTDDDGICDGSRFDNDEDGINPADGCIGSEENAGTNPQDSDSDDDNLIDGAEDQNGDGLLDAGETNPLDPDTDDDGFCDDSRFDNDDDGINPADSCGGSEVDAGTDPRDPNDPPPTIFTDGFEAL